METKKETCIYCGEDTTEHEPVPPVDDDETWELIAKDHLPTCEWVITRAHRLDN